MKTVTLLGYEVSPDDVSVTVDVQGVGIVEDRSECWQLINWYDEREKWVIKDRKFGHSYQDRFVVDLVKQAFETFEQDDVQLLKLWKENDVLTHIEPELRARVAYELFAVWKHVTESQRTIRTLSEWSTD